MNTRLILRPQDGGASTELPLQGRLLIGSDKSRADYVIEGSGIEGVHCAVGRLKDGGWAIKDLGSRFGTSVNGSPASTARLIAGDVIVLGSRRLIVEDPTEKTAPQAPTQSRAATSPQASPAPSEDPVTAPPAAFPHLASRSAPPQIPGYTIQRYLGKGASGSVWLARQESLARDVALKVLSPKLAQDADFVRRFQAEARAAAALNHPNVVHVYDVGASNGVHYLCMEFMDDGCLETNLLLNGPLPWREVLHVLKDSALGLAYAQTQGLVHRDIKPANLMRGSDGRTRLADLGLATSIEAVDLDGAQGTAANERKLVGTPQFLAPEVIRGEPASPASDIYSLGASAYRLLSGHTPFEAERTADVLRASLKDEPEGLGSRVPGLPAPVAGLVHRMLAKNPDARPASARVVVNEIDNILQGRAASNLPGVHTAPQNKRGPVVLVVLLLAAFLTWYFANLKGRNSENNGPGPEEPWVKTDPPPDDLQPTIPGPGPINGQEGATDPGTQDPPPVDDDAAEKAFEERAQIALQVLNAQTLTDLERIEALQALAQEWAGSSTASVALDTAENLKVQMGAAAQVDQQLDTKRKALLEALGAAAQFQPFSPELMPILARIDMVPGQREFAQDLAFQQAKNQILSGLFDGAMARADQVAAQTDKLLREGKFDEVEPLLQIFLEHLGLPGNSAGTAQIPGEDPRLALLRKREASAASTLRNLSNLEAVFQSQESGRDKTLVIQSLSSGGPDGKGILADLQAGKLAQAQASLASLLEVVRTPSLTTPLQNLQADMEAGRRAFNTLSVSFTSPGWRRLTVLDLRGRQASYEVLACDEDGPMVMLDGSPTLLGWAPFLNSAKALQYLFDRRLDRPLTSEEQVDVNSLLRLAAVMESSNKAEVLLAGDGLNQRNIDKLTVPFDTAIAHSEKSLSPAGLKKLTTELAAARTLSLALKAVLEDDPHTASVLLERLRDEFPGSVLRLLLEAQPAGS